MRVPKPHAHLWKFLVTGALALTVGHGAGRDPGAAEERGLALHGGPRRRVDRPDQPRPHQPRHRAHDARGRRPVLRSCPLLGGTRAAARGWSTAASGCCSAGRSPSTRRRSTSASTRAGSSSARGLTPEQAEEATPLHPFLIMGAGVAMMAALLVLLWLVARSVWTARSPVRALVLAGCGALAVGTLQGPVQAFPAVNELLDRSGDAGDVIVNLHAQLNMLGGLMLILLGAGAGRLMRKRSGAALAAARGRVAAAAVPSGMGDLLRRRHRVRRASPRSASSAGASFGAAVTALEPWPALVLVPGGARRRRRLRRLRAGGLAADGRLPRGRRARGCAPRRPRTPAGSRGACAGCAPPRWRATSCRWGCSGSPASAGCSPASRSRRWSLLIVGPAHGVGGDPARVLALRAGAAAPRRLEGRVRLAAGAARCCRPRCCIERTARRLCADRGPRRPAARRGGAGDSRARASVVGRRRDRRSCSSRCRSSPRSRASALDAAALHATRPASRRRSRGQFLTTPRGPVRLFAWRDPQSPYPRDALRVHARDVTRAADPRRRRRPAGCLPALRRRPRPRRRRSPSRAGSHTSLTLAPGAAAAGPGRYMLVASHEGMFGDRDFIYLTVVPPGAPVTPIARRVAALGARRSASSLPPVAAALLAALFALLLLRSFRRRRAGEKLLWAGGFLLFAVATACEAIGPGPGLERRAVPRLLPVRRACSPSPGSAPARPGCSCRARGARRARRRAGGGHRRGRRDGRCSRRWTRRRSRTRRAAARPPNGALGGHAFLWAIALNSFGTVVPARRRAVLDRPPPAGAGRTSGSPAGALVLALVDQHDARGRVLARLRGRARRHRADVRRLQPHRHRPRPPAHAAAPPPAPARPSAVVTP